MLEILSRSLYEPYAVDPKKFQVEKLIKVDKKVSQELLQDLEKKINYKVNV